MEARARFSGKAVKTYTGLPRPGPYSASVEQAAVGRTDARSVPVVRVGGYNPSLPVPSLPSEASGFHLWTLVIYSASC